jgi:hypothetical protein
MPKNWFTTALARMAVLLVLAPPEKMAAVERLKHWLY